MDVDSDILEVAVLDNEFDESFEEGKQTDDDQDEEMEAAEAEGNARFSAKQNADDGDEVNNDRVKEDLRSKINENRSRGSMQDDDGMSRNRKEEETDFRKRDYGKKSRGNHRSERLERNERLYKALDASSDQDPKILGREIAYRLGESKVRLIISVVEVLGFKCAMEILNDTKRIERRGGMLTADGRRRRTPGGVYIFCLKERGYATKEDIDKIFKEEKEKLKEKMKQKRREQAAKKRKEIEKLVKLKKRVIDYVNRKIEDDAEKDKVQITEAEINE